MAAAPSGAGTAPDSGELLYRLVDALQPDPAPDQMWLLCAGVFGAYPTADDVLSGIRKLRLASSADAMLWLLDRALERDSAAAANSELRIVSDRVVVDVDYSARHDLHTGIQQVVRSTLPRWQEKHPILPVAWTTRFDGWRGLSTLERPRLALDGDPEGEAAGQPEPVLIVPWRTVSVLLETPPLEACERLACLARYSGNALVAVGYDCVPVVSADLVPAADTVRFTHYLTTIKHARRVAGISTSAANEIRRLRFGPRRPGHLRTYGAGVPPRQRGVAWADVGRSLRNLQAHRRDQGALRRQPGAPKEPPGRALCGRTVVA